ATKVPMDRQRLNEAYSIPKSLKALFCQFTGLLFFPRSTGRSSTIAYWRKPASKKSATARQGSSRIVPKRTEGRAIGRRLSSTFSLSNSSFVRSVSPLGESLEFCSKTSDTSAPSQDIIQRMGLVG